SGGADERDPGHRSASRPQPGGAGRDRRTGHRGHGGRAGQRGLRRDRQAHPEAAAGEPTPFGLMGIDMSTARLLALTLTIAAWGEGLTAAHQPGQAVFKATMAEDLDWRPFAAFPPSVRLAVVVGQPSERGPYLIRVWVPRGVRLMPHRHPEDRIYTVISGVFYIGLGDQFDPDKLQAYPPGSVIVLPGNTSHFHWARAGDYITQVTAIGPLGIEYLDPKDDPRNGRSEEK